MENQGEPTNGILSIRDEIKISAYEVSHTTHENVLSTSKTTLSDYKGKSTVRETSASGNTAKLSVSEPSSIKVGESKNTTADQTFIALFKNRREKILLWLKTMAIYTYAFGAVSLCSVLK